MMTVTNSRRQRKLARIYDLWCDVMDEAERSGMPVSAIHDCSSIFNDMEIVLKSALDNVLHYRYGEDMLVLNGKRYTVAPDGVVGERWQVADDSDDCQKFHDNNGLGEVIQWRK